MNETSANGGSGVNIVSVAGDGIAFFLIVEYRLVPMIFLMMLWLEVVALRPFELLLWMYSRQMMMSVVRKTTMHSEKYEKSLVVMMGML
mmetsp:Transcript_25690/g.34081  ORF Transcript_25690/g.34081 Transcript_25690/m.34081 type:complete len:89 (-) Transcript_25690:469-735(-)